jgi:16S rRNA (adenine1518-N6/adenine1519-N6)-dimethyltransferase
MNERLHPDFLRARLQAIGAWSKKQLGQHFLVDEKALYAVVKAAGIKPEDTIVEVGPGLGVLTQELVERAKRVVAFELDINMAQVILKDFPTVELHHGDVLQEAPVVIPSLGSYKVVANIPYQITTPLIKLFIEGGVHPQPTSVTMLVQKEVGKRLAAKASESDRGYLSVLCQYYSDISYIQTVPAASFWPAPEVDSGIIHMQSRTTRPFEGEEEKKFLRFVKMLFTQKRKQLKNVVAGIRGTNVTASLELFAKVGLPEHIRAQELTEEQWVSLFKESL